MGLISSGDSVSARFRGCPSVWGMGGLASHGKGLLWAWKRLMGLSAAPQLKVLGALPRPGHLRSHLCEREKGRKPWPEYE